MDKNNTANIRKKALIVLSDIKDLGKAIFNSVTPNTTCNGCNGRGWLLLNKNQEEDAVICPICNGSGVKPIQRNHTK